MNNSMLSSIIEVNKSVITWLDKKETPVMTFVIRRTK